MNTLFFKALPIAALIATVGSVAPTSAQTANNALQVPSITEASVIPEGLIVPPDTTADVMIILDNSASMRNSLLGNGNGFRLGGHHPLSRSFQARHALRNVLANLQGDINVGLMEFDIGWNINQVTIGTNTQRSTNRDENFNTCGDLNPPEFPSEIDVNNSDDHDAIIEILKNHTPTPLFENCATGVIDEFRRLVANSSFKTGSQIDLLEPDDTGIGRLRAAIQPLDADHLERLNNILATEPQLPEIVGRNDFRGGDFIGITNPTIEDELSRTETESFRARYKTAYGPMPSTTITVNGVQEEVADLYLEPTAASLSTRGTPTYGAIVSAHDYMRGVNNPLMTHLLQSGDSLDTPIASSTPSANLSTASQCTVSSFIILITDGAPVTSLNGDNIVSNGNNDINVTQNLCNNSQAVSTQLSSALQNKGYSCTANDSSIDVIDSNGTAKTIPIAVAADFSEDDLHRLRHTQLRTATLLAAMREGIGVDINGSFGDLDVTGETFNPIQTFVFGFAPDDVSDSTHMASMAAAGSLEEIEINGVTTTRPRLPFLNDNSTELQEDLTNLFTSFSANITTSSGASISTSPISGGGASVSPSFIPAITAEVVSANGQQSTEAVYWAGEVESFFLDEFGFLREDNPTLGTQGELDGYTIDRAFEIVFNEDTENTEAQRLEIDGSDIGTSNFNPLTDIQRTEDPISPSDLSPIWSASDALNSQAQTTANSTVNLFGDVQRPYSSTASQNPSTGYRAIYSALPASFTGNNNELTRVDFVSSMVNNNNFGLFAADSVAQAQNIIRFTRGQEGLTTTDSGGDVVSLRDRTLIDEQYLLGDIVHSSPAVFDVPIGDFGSRFGDDSYIEFQQAHAFRRRMVYVGGNDGLLHAFNAGFFAQSTSSTNTKFATRASEIGCNTTTSTLDCDNVEHDLGAEIWAYAPFNLLPHLQFLTRNDYRSNIHVPFIDGSVKSFDVKIFENSGNNAHVNGWGTIIVAGMRQGGVDFEVDPNGDGNLNDKLTARSAYIVMDVTDPSEPPVVLAEITNDNFGFTTSEPDILRDGDDWYLVFGSGPNNIIDFTSSNQTPKFYRYQLNATNSQSALTETNISTNENGFVGNVLSHDWDSDATDDAVYFGVVSNEIDNAGGGIYRFVNDPDSNNKNQVRPLFITNRPITAPPVTASDNGADWVLFGTGRIAANADFQSTQSNSFYSIKEPRGSYNNQTTTNNQQLIDVTSLSINADTGSLVSPTFDGNGNITSSTNATVTITGNATGVNDLTTSEALGNAIAFTDSVVGWVRDLETNTPDPSERVTANPIIIDDQVVFASFTPGLPSTDQCIAVTGESFLNVAEIASGLPSPIASFGVGSGGTANTRTAPLGGTPIIQLTAVVTKSTTGGGAETSARGNDNQGGDINESISQASILSGRTSWTQLEVQ